MRFLLSLLCILVATLAQAGEDALDIVNAQRAARGLRPFIRDHNLSIAALRAADFRALHRISGHTSNDFAFVTPGTSVDAAGCAAWPQSLGFGSCCLYENWTFAGAAWAIGADGRRSCHLFVRGGNVGIVQSVSHRRFFRRR